jgi:hypothetical protein
VLFFAVVALSIVSDCVTAGQVLLAWGLEKREERREKRETERHQTTRLVSFTSFAYKSVCRS